MGRRVGRIQDEEQEKPELSAVLDHYGIEYRDKPSQKILCPVHDEKVPSCSVQINKGLWMCHSCGAGGDSFTLIMLKEGMDFGGAREFAATLGLATGEAGAGSEQVSGSAYGGRHRVPSRSRRTERGGGYVPAWKRR